MDRPIETAPLGRRTKDDGVHDRDVVARQHLIEQQ